MGTNIKEFANRQITELLQSKSLSELAQKLGSKFATLWTTIKPHLEGLGTNLTNFANRQITKLLEITGLRAIANKITTQLNMLWTVIKPHLEGLGDKIRQLLVQKFHLTEDFPLFDQLINKISHKIELVWQSIKSHLSKLKDNIKKTLIMQFSLEVDLPIFNQLSEGITSKLGGAAQWIANQWKKSFEFIQNLFGWLLHKAIELGTNLINALNHNPTQIIPNAWKNAIDYITNDLFGVFKQKAESLAQKLIESLAQKLIPIFTNIISQIKLIAPKILPWIIRGIAFLFSKALFAIIEGFTLILKHVVPFMVQGTTNAIIAMPPIVTGLIIRVLQAVVPALIQKTAFVVGLIAPIIIRAVVMIITKTTPVVIQGLTDLFISILKVTITGINQILLALLPILTTELGKIWIAILDSAKQGLLRQLGGELLQAIKSLIGLFIRSIIKIVKELWALILDSAQNGFLKQLGPILQSGIKNILIGLFKLSIAIIKGSAILVINSFKYGILKELTVESIKGVKNILSIIFNLLINTVKYIFVSLIKLIGFLLKSLISAIINGIKFAVVKIFSFIRSQITSTSMMVQASVMAYVQSISDGINIVINRFKVMAETIISAFASVKAAIKETFDYFGEKAKEKTQFVTNIVGSAADKGRNFLANAFSSVRGSMKHTAASTENNMTQMSETAQTEGKKIQKGLSEGSPGPTFYIRGFWKKTGQYVDNVMTEISKKAANTGDRVTFSFKDAANQSAHNLKNISKFGARLNGVNPSSYTQQQALKRLNMQEANQLQLMRQTLYNDGNRKTGQYANEQQRKTPENKKHPPNKGVTRQDLQSLSMSSSSILSRVSPGAATALFMVNDITNFTEELKNTWPKLMTTIAASGGIMGSLAKGIGLISASFVKLQLVAIPLITTLSAGFVAFAPIIAAVIAAIAGIVAIVFLFRKMYDSNILGIADSLQHLKEVFIGSIKSIGSAIMTPINELSAGILSLFGVTNAEGSTFIDLFKIFAGKIIKIITYLIAFAIAPTIKTLTFLIQAITIIIKLLLLPTRLIIQVSTLLVGVIKILADWGSIVVKFIGNIISTIFYILTTPGRLIQQMIQSVVSKIISLLSPVIEFFKAIGQSIANSRILGYLFGNKNKSTGRNNKQKPGFARGGLVSGEGSSTGDRVLANLSNGEFVVNAEATKNNLKTLEAINSGDEQSIVAPGLARGGLVSGEGSSTGDRVLANLSNGEFVVNADAAKNNLKFLEALNNGENFELTPLEVLPYTFDLPAWTKFKSESSSDVDESAVEVLPPAHSRKQEEVITKQEINITLNINGDIVIPNATNGMEASHEFLENISPHLRRKVQEILREMAEFKN
ncbi:hypothetical protein V6O07_21445 [Arthrospira platensis SPKY2]